MGVCFTHPGDKAKFEKLSSIVGAQEAYRDFFEHNGIVRTPAAVLQKLEERMLQDDPHTKEVKFPSYREEIDLSNSAIISRLQGAVRQHNKKNSIKAVERMSEQLGVPYEIVTPEQARQIHQLKEDLRGFYKGGKVFLVEGMYESDTVFHEFSHPIVKYLAKENTALFEKLFSEVSPELVEQIADKYKNLYDRDSQEFKEEVVVQAMTQAKEEDFSNPKSWIGRILYAIKQALRKNFGRKINLKNLSPQTSLKDLVQMIDQGNEFQLDMSILNEDDVLMAQKEYHDMINAVDKDVQVEVQKLTDSFASMLQEQISSTQKEGTVYKLISEELVDENNTGLLQLMNKVLKQLQGTKSLTVDTIGERYDYAGPMVDQNITAEAMAIRVNAFIDQLVRIDKIADIFGKKLDYLKSQNMDDYYMLDSLFAITEYLDQYSQFLNNALTGGSSTVFPLVDNPLREKLVSVNDKINNRSTGILSQANDLRANVVVDILYDHISKTTESADKLYRDQLQSLKENGKKSEYERMFVEYHGLTVDEMSEYNALERKYKDGSLKKSEKERRVELSRRKLDGFALSKDEFKRMLTSNAIDASFFNRMFESFMVNQDKAVGGFASYMQKYMNKIYANSNARQTELLKDNKLYELLEKAGWKNTRHITQGAMGKKLSSVVNIGEIDTETGDLTVKEEYQFKSNFKDFQADIKKLNYDLREAKENYTDNPTRENRDALAEAEEAIFYFKKNYMTQEYADAYYNAEELLYKDDVGREARYRMQDIYEEINLMGDAQEAAFDEKLNEQRSRKFQELSNLRNLFHPNGERKTGMDLQVAERLKEYFEQRNDFFEWEDREGMFQAAYNQKVQDLLDQGLSGEAFQEELDKFIEMNTTVMVDDNYFELRSQLLEKRKAILEPLAEVNKAIIDIGPLYEEIYEISKMTRESSGQYNGNMLSPEQQARLVELHDEIEEAKMSLYSLGGKGLTGEELEEYMALYEKSGVTQLTPQEEELFTEYRFRQAEGLKRLGLTEEDIKTLEMIDSRLGELSFSLLTDHYIGNWQRLMDENEDVRDVISDFLTNEFEIEVDESFTLTAKHIEELLKFVHRDYLNELRQFPEVAEWFERNHYRATRYQEKKKKPEGEKLSSKDYGTVGVWRNTTVWQFSSPSDLDFYKTFELTDENGNSSGVLELNGVPRVPNTNYQNRKVKYDYVTELITRDYVDENGNLVLANVNNRNEFLPKTVEQGAKDSRYIDASYKQMFNEDRATWDLLDYIKNWHLDSQEGNINNDQKLYLTYPKLRKRGIEDRFTWGYMQRRWQRFTDLASVRSDDFELGLRGAGSKFNENNIDRLDLMTRPVSGIYDIPLNEVSTDILETIQRHSHSLEEYKVFNEMNSFAKSLDYTLKKWSHTPETSQLIDQNRFLNAIGIDKGKLQRVQAFDAMLDEQFRGIQMADTWKGSKTSEGAYKLTNRILGEAMRWSSRKWFMFNPISGLTNYASGTIQMTYKLWDSKNHINGVDLMVGHRKAVRTLSEYARKTYSAKEKSAQMQLMDVLDASPDKYLRLQGDAGSRNILQDLYEGRVGYASRAYLTHEINYAAMYGFLNNRKYKFQINGQGKKVGLDKAVEIVDGRVQTIEGVPEEFSIRYDENGKVILGSKLNKLMNHHKGYLNKIHGMAGRNAEGDFFNRYLIGKMISFLFKFLPGMTMDRYQGKFRQDKNKKLFDPSRYRVQRRFNWYTEQAELGTYYSAIRAGVDMVQGRFNPEHLRGLAQMLTLYLTTFLIQMFRGSMTLNADDDDELRIGFYPQGDPRLPKHLMSATTAMKLPWVDKSRKTGNFEADDFFKLQLLRLTYRIERENNTFMPTRLLPIVGDAVMLNSPAQEGAVKDLKDMIGLTYNYFTTETPEERSERLRNEGRYALVPTSNKSKIGQDAGPYIWQQRDEYKFIHLISRLYGFNGALIDPAMAVKTEQKFPG